jgi:hypothetical protein
VSCNEEQSGSISPVTNFHPRSLSNYLWETALLSSELSRHKGRGKRVISSPSARPSRQAAFSITQVYYPEALVIKTPEFLLRKHGRPCKSILPICKRRRLMVLGSTPQLSQSSSQSRSTHPLPRKMSLLARHVWTSLPRNFALPPTPSKRNSLCTGIDGPEPAGTHGAKPTAS